MNLVKAAGFHAWRDPQVSTFHHERPEEAVLSMKNEKMLGADGIPTEVYKLVFRHQSDLHTARCVQCLPEGAVFLHKIR